MASIGSNIQAVRERIAVARTHAPGAAPAVDLLAVSKTFDASAVRAAFAAGHHAFGENQVGEALRKMAALTDLRSEMVWHLIGPLQSNKTRAVAESFDWVQTVDRLRVAQRLSDQRPQGLAPLQVCVQVNTSGEASKHGIAPADAAGLAHAVARLPRLRLRGLMAIPAPSDDVAVQRAQHRRLFDLWQNLNAQGLEMDTLSMGMSDDLEAAVAQGSTLVRVGRAIFGSRA